jgi:hypothetical protein
MPATLGARDVYERRAGSNPNSVSCRLLDDRDASPVGA